MIKKNLLIITCEQLGGDWYDIDKNLVNTPWLARISQKSWVSKRCYTSSPHCMPARFSWITGIAPSMLGITSNMRMRLNKEAPSIVRTLRDKGVETAIIGKTHWTSHTQEGDLRENEDLNNSLGFNKVIEIAGPKGLRKKTCKLTDDWKAYGCYDAVMDDMNARYKKGRSKDAWMVRPTVAPNKLYPDIWIKTEAIKVLEELKKSRKDW